ncbi:MAG: type II toxin-antitoxin system RelE/ParE family toxin [Candidatus Omnitrophota bacterium]
MIYELLLTRAAKKDREKIALDSKRRVDEELALLALNPRHYGVEKLKGVHSLYRVRSGDYRIIFSIDDHNRSVEIARIIPRKDAYR